MDLREISFHDAKWIDSANGSQLRTYVFTLMYVWVPKSKGLINQLNQCNLLKNIFN
jgi:hypothetical protein